MSKLMKALDFAVRDMCGHILFEDGCLKCRNRKAAADDLRGLRAALSESQAALGVARERLLKWQARLAGIGPMIDNQYAWKVQQELKWEMLSFADKELAAAIKPEPATGKPCQHLEHIDGLCVDCLDPIPPAPERGEK